VAIGSHAHPDHFGGLVEAKKLTGAAGWMHPADATRVERGSWSPDPLRPAPGVAGVAFHVAHPLLLWLIEGMARKGLFVPTTVEHRVKDGDQLPGGVKVIHVPGIPPTPGQSG